MPIEKNLPIVQEARCNKIKDFLCEDQTAGKKDLYDNLVLSY